MNYSLYDAEWATGCEIDTIYAHPGSFLQLVGDWWDTIGIDNLRKMLSNMQKHCKNKYATWNTYQNA